MIGFALSGGGSKIGFHYGALDVLMNKNGTSPDVVAGASAGALAGLCAAGKRLDLLKSQIDSITGFRDVYGGGVKTFALKLLASQLGWGDYPLGLYNTDPLQQRLRDVAGKIKTLNATFYPVRVRLEDGQIEQKTALDRVERDVLASASIPLLSEPVKRNGTWVDGGTRQFTPIASVMRHDLDEIYILNTQPRGQKESASVTDFSSAVSRVVDVMTDEIFRNDLRAFLDWNSVAKQAEEQGVEIQHPRRGRPVEHLKATILEPDEPLAGGTDFSPDALSRAVDAGRKAARKAIQ